MRRRIRRRRMGRGEEGQLTQWLLQMPVMTAGPKVLAGFILDPVYLIYRGQKAKKSKTHTTPI